MQLQQIIFFFASETCWRSFDKNYLTILECLTCFRFFSELGRVIIENIATISQVSHTDSMQSGVVENDPMAMRNKSFAKYKRSVLYTYIFHKQHELMFTLSLKKPSFIFYTYFGKLTRRVHRVATGAFWRTFHHEGKISPG